MNNLLQLDIWQKIKQNFNSWYVGLVPGSAIIAVVILARLAGFLQPLEWLVFDSFLRMRPEESIDERIVIIGINEEDIKSVKYPLSDEEVSNLLETLQTYNPRVIGIDIFKNSKNLIVIEKVLPEIIEPPEALPPEQIGFADAIVDEDSHLRRSLL